jgi:hypothetical protein
VGVAQVKPEPNPLSGWLGALETAPADLRSSAVTGHGKAVRAVPTLKHGIARERGRLVTDSMHAENIGEQEVVEEPLSLLGPEYEAPGRQGGRARRRTRAPRASGGERRTRRSRAKPAPPGPPTARIEG